MAKSILLTLFILNISATAFGKQKITVVTQFWDGYTNEDGSGGYWEILDESIGKIYDIKKSIVPWKRALKMVKSGQADGIVGVYKEFDYLVYPKKHVDTDIVDVIYNKEKNPNYKKLSDMKNKRVFRAATHANMKKFNFPIEAGQFNSLEQGLQILKRGRADFIVDYRSAIEPAAKKVGFDMSKHDIKVAFKGDLIYFALSKDTLKCEENRVRFR